MNNSDNNNYYIFDNSNNISKEMNNTTEKYYDLLKKKYFVNIPKYYLLNWCSLYETLYNNKIRLYDSKSMTLHMCSREESSNMAVDSYYYGIFKEKKQPISVSLNFTMSLSTLANIYKFKKGKKASLIIRNCTKTVILKNGDKYKLIYIYKFKEKNKNLYSMQFNYIDDENILLTVYCKIGSIKLKNILKYTNSYIDESDFFVSRKNTKHHLKIHKKLNPLDWHVHAKIKVVDKKKIVSEIIKRFNMNKDHIDNIFSSTKRYMNDHTEKIIYGNGAKSVLISRDTQKLSDYINTDNFIYKSLISCFLMCSIKGTIITRYSLPLLLDFDYKILYLLKKHFEEFKIYNPSLMFDTKDFYVVCKNFKGVSKDDIKKIEQLYNNLDGSIDTSKLLKWIDVPSDFNIYIDDIINKIIIKNNNIINNIKNTNDKKYIGKLIQKWFSDYKIPLRKVRKLKYKLNRIIKKSNFNEQN
jgi:hypothetical protein